MWLNKKKKIGLTILFVSGLILLGVILIYAFSNGQPKTPATCQQVTTVLTSLGYELSDTTSLYSEDDSHLVSSVTIENEKFVLISLNLIMKIVQLMCITTLVLKCTLIKVVI